MDAAPKAVLPVRPRFRPEDYITGNVPSVDSEEYKRILEEEEAERQKIAEEKLEREKQRETCVAAKQFVSEISAKLNTTGSRSQRARVIKRKSTDDSETGPPRQPRAKRRKKVTVKEITLKTDAEWSELSADESYLDSEEDIKWSDNIDAEMPGYSENGSLVDSEMDSEDSEDEDDHESYYGDERLLDYILKTHEDGNGLLLEETEGDPETPTP
uniref:Uncharacterized protein n=1 Tax=Panagrolaimus sp. JU765 TaxID=591449 RepID=A0AC34QDS4_9BILA